MKIQFLQHNTYLANQVYEKLIDVSEKIHSSQNDEELSALSKDQQKTIFEILKEIDLSTMDLRKNFAQRIEADPKITRVVHFAISSRKKREDNYLALDQELIRSSIDGLQYIELESTNLEAKHTLIRDWWTKYSVLFDKTTLELLSTDDLYQLTALLYNRLGLNLPMYQTILQNLPENGKKYCQILQLKLGLSEFWREICKIHPNLSEDRFIALSHYVSSKQILFRDIQSLLSPDDLSELLPYLRFGNFTSVEDDVIINGLQNSTRLQYIEISSSTITILPELPTCVKLSCFGCTSLGMLPELPACKILICAQCQSLAALPELPACIKLGCASCLSLKTLPDLSRCAEFICSDCTALTTLPALPVCTHFFCSGCTALTVLPALPACIKLSCSGCSALTELSELPACIELNCSDCTSLRQLPEALPACEFFNCENCPSLTNAMPELPWNAQVYTGISSHLQFTKLEVDLEELVSNPRELLLDLGWHLLQDKPFPNIYYLLKGEISEAIDIGGVRRDFISRLMESLFTENPTENPVVGKLVMSHDKFPRLNNKQDIDCYRTLGRIFALCYPQNSYFKIGALFSTEVYKKIAFLADPLLAALDIASDENIVLMYLYYRNFPGFLRLIDASDSAVQQIDESILQNACIFLGIDEEKRPSYFEQIENRKLLKKEVIVGAQLDPQFQAIRLIAQEIKRQIGINDWNKLHREGAEKLQDRIEGVLSKEAVLSKLRWEEASSGVFIHQQLKEKTKGYLKNWIERASLDHLRKFVRAVTSNNTIGPNPLKIEIFNRGPEFIPVAHTCDFNLELSADYPDQETFDKKLLLLLTEGMAGDGFQIA